MEEVEADASPDIVEMKDVPEAAAAAIKRAARGATIKQIEKSQVRARIVRRAARGGS